MKLNFRTGAAFASKKASKCFKNKNPEDIKSVVVIRHAAIGDFVIMRPFLIELRKFFSNAKITLSVLRNQMYGIPDDLVDKIHIMDKMSIDGKNKKTGLFSRIKQARELKNQDIIFDLTDSTMSLLVVFFADVKIKVGYSYRATRRFFYDISVYRSDFVLETESMFHQLNVLGANTQHYPLNYALTTVKTNRIKPYIIYFAGASIQGRCWEIQKFIDLISKMLVCYPSYEHVVLKGIREEEHFLEIYKPFKHFSNVVYQDALPINKIYDYLAGSSLVIVGDTGIRNMAIASNAPTIGIMWAPYISPLRYLPKTLNHQVVFNTNFVQPSVEEVLISAQNLMNILYEN